MGIKRKVFRGAEGSNLRSETLSQPCVTGDFGSGAAMNVISLPSGSKAHTVAKMSISGVLEETKSFAFTGPTISRSCAQGEVEKVTPSLSAA